MDWPGDEQQERDAAADRGGREDGSNTDLYALLHVPREASDEELTRAYRQLATVYHPDKYPSPQMQEVAKENFQRIKAAYDVLSDPGRRQVYDVYGKQGLEAGLDVGPVLRTREEIRELYKRAEERRREAEAAARTHHASTLSLSISAADALSSGLRLPVQVLGMQMGTQVQASLSPWDTIALGGSMLSRRNAAGGQMLLLYRRQVTPLHAVEATAAIGLRSLLTVATSRQVTPSLKATSALSIQLADGEVSLNNTWAYQMSEGTTGTVQWGLGAGAGLAVGWQTQVGLKNTVTGELKVGEGLSVLGASAVYVRKFSERSTGRASFRLGTAGADLEVGASRRVSENSSAGLSVLVGLQGIMWKVRYTRGGQKLIVPILLSRRLSPERVLAAAVLPGACLALYKLWQKGPWERQRQRNKELAQRMQTADAVRTAMKEARGAQELMSAAAERKRRQQQPNGLIILSAFYGHLDSAGGSPVALLASESDASQELPEEAPVPPAVWDVRIPLQFLVDDAGNLLLHAGISKRGVMGACDPAPGLPKALQVRYLHGGKEHEVKVGDLDELRLPNSVHRRSEASA